MSAQCTAPKRGHKVGSSEWVKCPVHGGKNLIPSVGRLSGPPPTAKRTSIHRAASGGFDPEQYEAVDFWDLDTMRGPYLRASKDTEWAEDVPHGDQCSHCGARLRYVAVLRHSSGEHITVGETCLGDRFAGSAAEFEKVRETGKKNVLMLEAELMRLSAGERQAMYDERGIRALEKRVEKKATIRDAMYEQHPLVAAVTYPEMFQGEHRIESLSLSLDRWLEDNAALTEGQIRYFENTYEQGLGRIRVAKVDKARKDEAAAMGFGAPRGDGIEITGFVTSLKLTDNYFGPSGSQTLKMRLTLPGGAGVYLTVPSSLAGVAEGDQVSLTANFSAPTGGDDPMFSYGKRPRKASIIDEG